MDRPEQDALDRDAAQERHRDRDRKGDPIGLAPSHQLPGDKGRKHCHLALGEIEVVDRLVDHHHGERHQRVDATGRQSGHDLLQEQFHQLIPQIGAPDRLVGANDAGRGVHHDPTGFEQIGVIGEIERERDVLLDHQHRHPELAIDLA